MMKFKLFAVLFVFGFAGCSVPADRFAVPAPPVAGQERMAFSSLEVRKVSLPTYALSDEISVQTEDGRLLTYGTALWADAPERAIALELSRHLAQITRARVASEPWPFEAFPQARLDVRFESLLARADGQFEAKGQYFVAVDEGRERSGLFNLTVPYDVTAGPSAIAAARGQIVLDLARYILRDGLR